MDLRNSRYILLRREQAQILLVQQTRALILRVPEEGTLLCDPTTVPS